MVDSIVSELNNRSPSLKKKTYINMFHWLYLICLWLNNQEERQVWITLSCIWGLRSTPPNSTDSEWKMGSFLRCLYQRLNWGWTGTKNDCPLWIVLLTLYWVLSPSLELYCLCQYKVWKSLMCTPSPLCGPKTSFYTSPYPVPDPARP